MASDRAWTISYIEMNFHKEIESSESIKVFIRREKSTVRVDRHMESRTLESLFGAFFSRFPLANYLALTSFESEFVIIQDPSMCACASFSQHGFQQRGLWVVDITYYEVTPSLF